MRPERLIIIICLLAAICGCTKKEEPANVASPPPEIQVYVTKSEEVPIFEEFVGQIYGLKDIAIRARVEGFLEEVHFEEGSRVNQGDLLYTMESQPFEADVAAKMSGVAGAQTQLAKAVSDLSRIRPLAKQKAVSQSDLDGAVARHEAAIASLEAAKANLRASKIQLGYTKIYSPLTGIIGRTKAKVGDFVGRSPNPVILNTVSQIDTVLVQFFITETQYLQLARRILKQKDVTRQGDPAVDLELILADGSRYGHEGKSDFVDREVDPTTGAILVQASFPNPDELLRPGQFARIKAKVKVVKGGILIPQRSVIELQGLFNIFVVDDGNRATLREIKVGPKIKDFWLISEGLKPGEKVIFEGLQRVKDGTIVNPTVKEIQPTDKENK